MLLCPSSHPPGIALPFPLPKPNLTSGGITAIPSGFDTSVLGISALKSFGMLVGVGGWGYAKRSPELPKSGNCQNWKPQLGDRCRDIAPRAPEARYAYYRRCQQFRHNGEQCKAPAMKGESICHRHAEQVDAERRREEQWRELLARPGVGFESFAAIQRTLSELVAALFEGSIDHKTAVRLIVDIQNAIRMQKMIAVGARARARLARRGFLVETKGREKKIECHRKTGQRRKPGAESPVNQGKHPFAAINGRSSTPHGARVGAPLFHPPREMLSSSRQKAIMVDG